MRVRPASRLLVVDPEERVLLFQFSFPTGALTGQTYWATPGGGLEEGESFAEAAGRELFEETGMRTDDVGPEVARRCFPMRLTDGEEVLAEERFFLVRTEAFAPTRENWTVEEATAIVDHRWWALDDIDHRTTQIWPEDLAVMVRAAR